MADTLKDCERRDQRTRSATTTAAAWSRLEDHARWSMLETVHTDQHHTTCERPPTRLERLARWLEDRHII